MFVVICVDQSTGQVVVHIKPRGGVPVDITLAECTRPERLQLDPDTGIAGCWAQQWWHILFGYRCPLYSKTTESVSSIWDHFWKDARHQRHTVYGTGRYSSCTSLTNRITPSEGIRGDKRRAMDARTVCVLYRKSQLHGKT